MSELTEGLRRAAAVLGQNGFSSASGPVLRAVGVIEAYEAAAGAPRAPQTPAQVAELADAMWQLLSDMDVTGLSVCGAAKAKARVAYEPFRGEPEDEEGIMPLAEARAVLADIG